MLLRVLDIYTLKQPSASTKPENQLLFIDNLTGLVITSKRLLFLFNNENHSFN